MQEVIQLIAEPADALIDEPVQISATGAAPNEALTLRAALETDDGARFCSETALDDEPMKWAWSMSRVEAPKVARDPFALPGPARVTLECVADGRTILEFLGSELAAR